MPNHDGTGPAVNAMVERECCHRKGEGECQHRHEHCQGRGQGHCQGQGQVRCHRHDENSQNGQHECLNPNCRRKQSEENN